MWGWRSNQRAESTQKQDQQLGLSGISGQSCEVQMGRQARPDPGPAFGSHRGATGERWAHKDTGGLVSPRASVYLVHPQVTT